MIRDPWMSIDCKLAIIKRAAAKPNLRLSVGYLSGFATHNTGAGTHLAVQPNKARLYGRAQIMVCQHVPR
jgi:hypothetical protein